MGKLVIATYRPKPGKDDALREVIAGHLDVLRRQDLVTDREPVRMCAADGTILEIFEWASDEAALAAHSNPEVQALWRSLEGLCDHVPLKDLPEAKERFASFDPVTL